MHGSSTASALGPQRSSRRQTDRQGKTIQANARRQPAPSLDRFDDHDDRGTHLSLPFFLEAYIQAGKAATYPSRHAMGSKYDRNAARILAYWLALLAQVPTCASQLPRTSIM